MPLGPGYFTFSLLANKRKFVQGSSRGTFHLILSPHSKKAIPPPPHSHTVCLFPSLPPPPKKKNLAHSGLARGLCDVSWASNTPLPFQLFYQALIPWPPL